MSMSIELIIGGLVALAIAGLVIGKGKRDSKVKIPDNVVPAMKGLYVLHMPNEVEIERYLNAGFNTLILPQYNGEPKGPPAGFLTDEQIEHILNKYHNRFLEIWVIVNWYRPYVGNLTLNPENMKLRLRMAQRWKNVYGARIGLDTEHYSAHKGEPDWWGDKLAVETVGPLMRVLQVQGEMPRGPDVLKHCQPLLTFFTEHTYTKDQTGKIAPKAKQLWRTGKDFRISAGIYYDKFSETALVPYYEKMLQKYHNVWLYSHGPKPLSPKTMGVLKEINARYMR